MITLLLSVLLVGSGNDQDPSQPTEIVAPSQTESQDESMTVVPARELVPEYDPNEWDWAYWNEQHKA